GPRQRPRRRPRRGLHHRRRRLRGQRRAQRHRLAPVRPAHPARPSPRRDQRVTPLDGELRAGGTDLMSRPHTGPYVDLHDMPDMSGISWRADGSARIGALTTISAIAADERLRDAYPALTLTAAGLATPQIRAVATLGGNLLQRNRCWYFRNPAFTCFQNGGDSCPARAGVGLYASVIDISPCLAPHPSSMA